MKEPVAILLDADRVRVLAASATGALLAEVPWDPEAPAEAAAALRPALSRASSIVLVVGLGLLEIARPELPPLAARQRRALLLRDADRYFPIASPVAVAWTDGFALATDAARLESWVNAFQGAAMVATTTVVACLSRAGANGTWALPAGAGESGRVVIASGMVRDVRRVPRVAASRDPVGGDGADPARARDVELAAVARGAAAVADAPLDDMLLDDRLARRFAGVRRVRWARSLAALLFTAVALGASADRWRQRELDAADAWLVDLTTVAEPALRAEVRLQRARNEAAMLGTTTANEPGAVLERLGALLPRDAFIQRLEWDGAVWRVDGSASDAPRIVPLLDADARLTDVRIVAASTRFIDAGAQRESFSISFRSVAPGGTSAR